MFGYPWLAAIQAGGSCRLQIPNSPQPRLQARQYGTDGSGRPHCQCVDQRGDPVTKYTKDNSNFGADGPFFRIIREGLKGLVDGEDYFDLLSDDVAFDFVISVPGYPRHVQGRQNIIDLYSGYDDFMAVHNADNLRVYRDAEASVVVLEYEVHGYSVRTGRPYNNRFVSIVTIANHKVAHWRDYLDPIAVFDTAGWPGQPETV